jgi:hypothetical protein
MKTWESLTGCAGAEVYRENLRFSLSCDHWAIAEPLNGGKSHARLRLMIMQVPTQAFKGDEAMEKFHAPRGQPSGSCPLKCGCSRSFLITHTDILLRSGFAVGVQSPSGDVSAIFGPSRISKVFPVVVNLTGMCLLCHYAKSFTITKKSHSSHIIAV